MPTQRRLGGLAEDELERLEGWLFGAGGLTGAQSGLSRRFLARGPARRGGR